MVSYNENKISKADFWNQVSQLNQNNIAQQQDVYQTFYWLNDGMF
jgi:hypothetical protein